MSLRVRFEGVEEYRDVLRRTPVNLRGELDDLMEQAARETAEAARKRVHVVTGFLRSTIAWRREAPLKLRVEAAAPYAAYEEARGGGHRFMGPSVEGAKTRLRQRLRRSLR